MISNTSLTATVGQLPLPFAYQVLFTSLYTLTGALSIVGNGLVVTVLLARHRLPKGVRWYLINLAVADLLMTLICIPFTCFEYVFGRWVISIPECRFYVFTQQTTTLASVFILTAIGIDRYLAIVFPFKFQAAKSNITVIFVVAVIWVASIGFSVDLLVFDDIVIESRNYVTHYWCLEGYPTTKWKRIYPIFLFLLNYIFPLSVLSYTYTVIVITLTRQRCPGNANAKRDHIMRKNKIKVIKLSIKLVLLFAFCCLPLQIYDLIIWKREDVVPYLNRINPNLHQLIFTSFLCLAVANCWVNPLVYSLSHDELWNDLRSIFRKSIKEGISKTSTPSTLTI